MAKNKTDLLEVHVLAAAQGESIIIRLPTGEWGVVDSYARSLKDPETNATVQFLRQRNVDELAFVCLTHPHFDHYRGMSQILESFTVHQFWRPSVLDSRRIGWLLKAAKRDAAELEDRKALEDIDELEQIFSTIRQQNEDSGTPTIVPKAASTESRLLERTVGKKSLLEIWSLAPSARQIDVYDEHLSSCFDDAGKFQYSRHHQANPNIVSMALRIKFGDTQIVLGGDVECDGWSDVLEETNPDYLSAQFVKISHHGSTNGFCDGLWAAFSRDGMPDAVVTPFKKHGLPESDALSHIQDFTQQLFTPCLGAVEELGYIDLGSGDLRSRFALNMAFRTIRVGSFPVGLCSFFFDDERNITHREFSDGAGLLPK